MKKLTRGITLRHLKKYSQYTQNQNWLKWYSKVAPLKGGRTAKILFNYKDGKAKLLDLGCGTGLTLAVLARYFPDSMGCDVGKKEVKASKELLKLLKIKSPVILYDGRRLPFDDNTFDIVTSIEVIEHVFQPGLMLREIKRVLKPDGILHITTANKWWPIEPHYHLPFLSYLPRTIASYYLKVSKRGLSYDINLPSYGKFYREVNANFYIDDITLDVIKNYKKYRLDKERCLIISIVGRLLNLANNRVLDFIFVRLSLGWLFIAKPRK